MISRDGSENSQTTAAAPDAQEGLVASFVRVLRWLVGVRKAGASLAAHASDELRRRRELRLPTRSRSARVLRPGNAYVCDCAIIDRSQNGMGLRIAPNIPIAPKFRLRDDITQEILAVSVAWRNGASLGVRILDRDGFTLL